MKKRKKKLKLKLKHWIAIITVSSFAIFGFCCAIYLGISFFKGEDEISPFTIETPEFSVDLLSINEYSRPGLELPQVKNIVVHYTANPGSSAKENRDYFEGLSTSHLTYASSHFIVGLGGEVIQCIPTAEICYAVGDGPGNRNFDTISIEVCHTDMEGQFLEATYNSLVRLCAWLCSKFDLTPDDLIRHHDVSGKACPKYYVEHGEAWEAFKEDVREYILENGSFK